MFDQIQLAAERDFAVRNLDRAARSYGVCVRCEESIPLRRLEAAPWAAFCVACQDAVDQDTTDEREHLTAFAEPVQLDHQAA